MQILAVSLIFSQPSDEVMQRATHIRDIYDQGHALLHSKSEEEAASCASMLATPMHGCSDSKNGNVPVLEVLKARAKGTEYK